MRPRLPLQERSDSWQLPLRDRSADSAPQSLWEDRLNARLACKSKTPIIHQALSSRKSTPYRENGSTHRVAYALGDRRTQSQNSEPITL